MFVFFFICKIRINHRAATTIITMMVEDDIFQFNEWATRMGIPEEAIPPTEALKEYVGSNSENKYGSN